MLNRETIVTPPVAAATVVLLRDAPGAPGGFEVLLQKRHAASSVLGGAHVFPGGKVDPADAEPDRWAQLDRTPPQLHAALGEAGLAIGQAAALYVAAIREVFEEAGVRLRAGDLMPWSRWITPRRPSVMNRRFDTRFFVCRVAAATEVVHDDFEAVESLWVAPADALRRYWARELVLAGPQLMSLGHLAQFRSIGAVIGDAAAHGVRLIEPHVCEIDGIRVTCYPGDPLHPVSAAVLPGPSRLAFRDDRFEPVGGLAAWLG
ncbi:MAG: NUDIX domain-containing protein [Lautropia sp.]